MIIINDIHLPLDEFPSDFIPVAARELKVEKKVIKSAELYRKSVDARKKNDVHFCCSLLVSVTANEQSTIKKCKKARIFREEEFVWPEGFSSTERPVIVGFGPAGMFAALTLARAGLKPIVLERGEEIEKRVKTVDGFFGGDKLNTESNVQFGEGGAGTFSDGKLNTGIKNIRCRAVLREFVRFGADQKILIDAKPHVGTDRLVKIVKNLREEIISLGGEVRFSTRLDSIRTKDGVLCEIVLSNGDSLPCSRLILATGHSARDTFLMLKNEGVPMERKPFSVGARIEHKRADIDRALYGDFAGHPALSAADYKLAAHLENGRGVYTFCMCPGGVVVNASSEEGGIAVNGMSYSARDGENSNSAVLADIRPEELSGDDVLAGVELQRKIEQKAFSIGGGAVPSIALGRLIGKETTDTVSPSVKPEIIECDIHKVLPKDIADSIIEGIRIFGKKIEGFDSENARLTFPETRSSSPVRILRGDSFESVSVRGLFPCGEGAGYAGGIMSAAVDGIRVAEAVIATVNQ
ncbi:MAG: NAD(P)/FAD-dependent oxidoreductase [Clostridia bacterium]|nr:NAD(P)/FAD-dependent oxidoreductase [Clostridia bacterium]